MLPTVSSKVVMAGLQIPGGQGEQGRERFEFIWLLEETHCSVGTINVSLALICKINWSRGALPQNYREIH